jgi:hypothetical protein
MPPIFKKDDRFKQGIFKPKNPEKFLGKFAIFRSSYERAFFLKMDNNEKALYELEFIFGYISLIKQYEFILFIKYLIENKFIELLSRYNTSLIVKIYRFILNYNINKIGKREGLNRITLYPIVKNCVLNLCD